MLGIDGLRHLVLGFLVLYVMPLGASPKPLTLKETIDFALEHAPQFQSAQRQFHIEELTESSAFSKFLPALDFTTTNGIERDRPPSGTDPFASSLALTLSENLYDNGQTLTKYKEAQLIRERARIQLLKARDLICLNVAKEFYNYSLQTKLISVKKEQHQILEKQLVSVETQFRQGIKTKKDFLRLKSQVQKARINLDDAIHGLEESALQLQKLMGAPIGEREKIEFATLEPQMLAGNIPKAELKLEKNYVSKINRLSTSINELAVDLVRRDYWPQIHLTTSAFYQNANYFGGSGSLGNGNEVHGWNALITLKYNIFDWGIRNREIEIAESKRMILEDTNRAELLGVNAETSKLVGDLQLFEEKYKLQQELLQSEQESYNLVLADYRSGRIPYIDMITNLNDLLDAKVGFLAVYFQLLTQVAVYHFHEGTLYEKVLAK